MSGRRFRGTTAIFELEMKWASAIIFTAAGICSGFQGDGTAYTLNAPPNGNCNIQSYKPAARTYYAAMNDAQWNTYQTCGMCVNVRCIDAQCPTPRKSVTVQILDRCPECKHGDLDMSPEAFLEITGSSPSRLVVEWDFVPCPSEFASGPIEFCLKKGSNRYWTAIQPVNAKRTITKMTVNGSPAELNEMDAYYFLTTQGVDLHEPAQITVTTAGGITSHHSVVLGSSRCVPSDAQTPVITPVTPAPEEETPEPSQVTPVTPVPEEEETPEPSQVAPVIPAPEEETPEPSQVTPVTPVPEEEETPSPEEETPVTQSPIPTEPVTLSPEGPAVFVESEEEEIAPVEVPATPEVTPVIEAAPAVVVESEDPEPPVKETSPLSCRPLYRN